MIQYRRDMILFLVGICLVGCAPAKPPLPQTNTVRGEICYASGEPIALGVIQFTLADNPSLNISGTIKDGQFEINTAYGNDLLPGAMPGVYRVTAVPAFEQTPVTFQVAKPVEIGAKPAELRLRCEPQNVLNARKDVK